MLRPAAARSCLTWSFSLCSIPRCMHQACCRSIAHHSERTKRVCLVWGPRLPGPPRPRRFPYLMVKDNWCQIITPSREPAAVSWRNSKRAGSTARTPPTNICGSFVHSSVIAHTCDRRYCVSASALGLEVPELKTVVPCYPLRSAVLLTLHTNFHSHFTFVCLLCPVRADTFASVGCQLLVCTPVFRPALAVCSAQTTTKQQIASVGCQT